MPLQVGNVWVYNGVGGNPNGHGSWYDQFKIISTTQISGKTYFVIQHNRIIITSIGMLSIIPIRLFNNDLAIRIDSITANIYQGVSCGTFSEKLIDSLKTPIHDSAIICGNVQGNIETCSDTALYKLFGSERRSKNMNVTAFEGGSSQIYVKDIGVVQYIYQQHMEGSQYTLRGCVINGYYYGDTTFITGINKNNSEIPDKFSLSQNYPNPFNPNTIIKFQIAKSSDAKLIVYDALGKEVEILVDKKLDVGEYQAEFDGANLPSGVYYYKLTARDYSETKKMVLIK